MKQEKPILVSFGAGRTSAMLCYYMKFSEKYKDRDKVFVFANTGKEREETLEYAARCSREWGLNLIWLEAVINPIKGKGNSYKIVDFQTANRTGKPFEDMIAKYGIPNKTRPHCTRELKTRPIHKYMQKGLGYKKGEYDTVIGYRLDEAHRATKKPNYIYPFIKDVRATKAFIREWWEKQNFDLQLKDYQGNCDLCWKKSKRKLLTLLVEEPWRAKWWAEMEAKYGEDEYTFYRGNMSMLELIEESQRPFRKAIDEQEQRKQAPPMYDPDLDFEMHCFCAST